MVQRAFRSYTIRALISHEFSISCSSFWHFQTLANIGPHSVTAYFPLLHMKGKAVEHSIPVGSGFLPIVCFKWSMIFRYKGELNFLSSRSFFGIGELRVWGRQDILWKEKEFQDSEWRNWLDFLNIGFEIVFIRTWNDTYNLNFSIHNLNYLKNMTLLSWTSYKTVIHIIHYALLTTLK